MTPTTNPASTDAVLLQRWLSGERSALDLFCARHRDLAWRHAMALSGSTADADDAVQTAFLAVCRRAAAFRRGEDARAWLLTIVANACRDLARARHRRQARHHAAELPMDVPPTPDHRLNTAEQTALVHAALAELPDRYRHPLRLHHLEGLATAAVAQALGRSRKTVESQLLRGRDLLREALLRRNFDLSALALPGLLSAMGPGSGAPPATVAALQGALAPATAPSALSAWACAHPILFPGAIVMSALSIPLLIFVALNNFAVSTTISSNEAVREVLTATDEQAPLPSPYAIDLDRPISVPLVRATLNEALREVAQILGSPQLPLDWSTPWDPPWPLHNAQFPMPHYQDRPFISLTSEARPARAILDAIAEQAGLTWRLHRGQLALLEPLPSYADDLRQRYQNTTLSIAERCAAAKALARSGEVPAMAWLIRAALASQDGYHPARRWVMRHIAAYSYSRNRHKGWMSPLIMTGCHLILANIDRDLVAEVATQWNPDEPLLAGLGAMLGVDRPDIRARLIQALHHPEPDPLENNRSGVWDSNWKLSLLTHHAEQLVARDPTASKPFLALLTTPGIPAPLVRELCVRFQRLRHAAAVPALMGLLDGPHRQVAAKTILTIDFDAHHKSVIQALGDDLDNRLRIFASVDEARASRLVGDDARLDSMMSSSALVMHRFVIPRLLAGHTNSAAKDILNIWLNSKNEALREHTASALAARGHDRAIEIVTQKGWRIPELNYRLAEEADYTPDLESLRTSADLSTRKQALSRLASSRTHAGAAALRAALDDPELNAHALTLTFANASLYISKNKDFRNRLLSLLTEPKKKGHDLALEIYHSLDGIAGHPEVLPHLLNLLHRMKTDEGLAWFLLQQGNIIGQVLEAVDSTTRIQIGNLLLDLTDTDKDSTAKEAREMIRRFQALRFLDLEQLTGRRMAVPALSAPEPPPFEQQPEPREPAAGTDDF